MAVQMGLEPTISSGTGRHVNHYTTGPFIDQRIDLAFCIPFLTDRMAVQMGLEPTISSVTGRHVNHYTTGPSTALNKNGGVGEI